MNAGKRRGAPTSLDELGRIGEKYRINLDDAARFGQCGAATRGDPIRRRCGRAASGGPQ